MVRRKLSHLETRGGVFWLRIVVPRDLHQRVGRREWRFSLRTREPLIARLRCLETTLAVARLHTIIRSMRTLTDTQIADIAKAYLAWALKHAVDGAQTMAAGPLVAELDGEAMELRSVQQLDDGAPENERKALIEALNRKRADLVVQKQGWAAKHLAAEFSNTQGIDFAGLDAASQAAVLHALRRAEVEEYRIRLAQMEGNYAEAVARDPLFNGVALPLQVDWCTAPKPPAEGPTLGEVIDRYVNEKKTTEWVRKTLLDNQRVLRWFQELTPRETPMKKVTKADVRAFKDALFHIPPNFQKLKPYSGKTLPEVVAETKAKPDTQRLSPAARSKYLSKLKAFLTWCENEYDISSSGRGVTVPEPDDAQDRRDPFSAEQLHKLFHSPLYVGHGKRRHKPGTCHSRDGMFWVPLVCMFTGMRLGEVAQLCVEDIRQIDGVWCIDNSPAVQPNDGPKKQFKTKTSKRVVPIHPELLTLGFLDHVDGKRGSKKSNRVFPEINAGSKNDWSANISKMLNRYLRYIGVKTPKIAVHSFRHNFADACEQAASMHYLMKKALLGHHDPSVTALYGSKPSAQKLFEGISQIKFDVNLDHLVPASVRASPK